MKETGDANTEPLVDDRRRTRRWWRRLPVVGAGTLLLAALLSCAPAPLPELAPDGDPSLAIASERVAAMQRTEDGLVKPPCRTRLLGEPSTATDVVVLLHGLSSCPAQFESLGATLQEAGYTVLIPRLPGHGLLDEEGALLAVTFDDLVRFADETVSLARALGNGVTVVGLSAGGAIASYMAQRSVGVDRVIAIAPLLGLAQFPPGLTPVVASLARGLTEVEATFSAAPHSYSSAPYPAVGTYLELALSVRDDASRHPPTVTDLGMILNENDNTISNPAIADQVAAWRSFDGVIVAEHLFPRDLGFRHDLIDPYHQGNGLDTGIVYPVVVDMITR